MGTLSLEPLKAALPSLADTDGPSLSAKAAAPLVDKQSLAARLQRLWQERGEFHKLNTADLQKEIDDGVDVDDVDGDKAQKTDNAPDDDAEKLQTLAPEQMYELKTRILTGLGLAKADVLSALDLLQLLLNPLGALNPAVPEEALALPSGSLKATSLKTPIPAPTEQAHLTTTGLSLGSKSKALSTSADVLRNAGQRLRTTTDTAQAEWTELLRIKRGGEWRMEARASASASGAGSTSEYANIDRLARDVCVFCGIDEASAAWRQAGLARFNDSKGKGRATDQATFKLPDRIGGRRRLALSVSFGSAARATYTYAPEALSAEISDTHSQLAQLQVELFEEELFARLIQEVRDGDLDAEATRDSLELRIPEHEATLRLHMLASGSKQAAVSTNPEQGLQHLPELLHAVARLAMLRLYKRRRRRNTTKDLADQIIPHLIAVTQYVLFVRQIRERLQDAADACRRSGVYSSADSVVLHFDACTDAVSDITADLASESDEERGGPILRLGGSATFIIGSRSLHFTFRAPATLIVHLPDRDLALDVNAQLRLILQQAVLAATLGQVAILLQDLCHACPDWQSETLPKTIDSTTRALAKQKSKKHSSAPAAFLAVAVTTAGAEAGGMTLAIHAEYWRRGVGSVSQAEFGEASTRKGSDLRSWLDGQMSNV